MRGNRTPRPSTRAIRGATSAASRRFPASAATDTASTSAPTATRPGRRSRPRPARCSSCGSAAATRRGPPPGCAGILPASIVRGREPRGPRARRADTSKRRTTISPRGRRLHRRLARPPCARRRNPRRTCGDARRRRVLEWSRLFRRGRGRSNPSQSHVRPMMPRV